MAAWGRLAATKGNKLSGLLHVGVDLQRFEANMQDFLEVPLNGIVNGLLVATCIFGAAGVLLQKEIHVLGDQRTESHFAIEETEHPECFLAHWHSLVRWLHHLNGRKLGELL